MLTHWHSIGEFNAAPGVLLRFIDEHAVRLIEHASGTPSGTNSDFTAVIRGAFTKHRDIVIHMLDWVRKGHEPNSLELLAMTDQASNEPDEFGDPMTTLYIISILYNALKFLREQQITPVVLPDTTIIEPPQPVKRPVLNFIKTIFGKK